VEHEGRSVVIAADHVVLPYTQFVQRLDGEQVQVAAQKIREELVVGSSLRRSTEVSLSLD